MGTGILNSLSPYVKVNEGGPPPEYFMGLRLPYRKEQSAAFVPSRADRAKLRRGIIRMIVIPYALAPQQTLEFFGVAPGNFYITQLVGSLDPTPGVTGIGYQAMFYDPVRRRQLTDQPVNYLNAVGDAHEPWIFKKPYLLQPNTELLARLTNLETVAISGQIVLWGYIIAGAIDQGEIQPGPGLEAVNPFQQVQQPPWIAMPASGEIFFPAAFITIPAVGQTLPIVKFQVPAGRSGVINRLANEVVGAGGGGGAGWVNGSGQLVWQILINGAVVKNCENIVAQLGTVAAPSEIPFIRLRENDLVQLTVTNVSINPPAGQRIGGRMQGWYYPKELDQGVSFST